MYKIDIMGEQYTDNLKFPQLERQQIKDALIQKEIVSAQQKESTLYKEVLRSLSPKQIAQLIQKNYADPKGKFLAYNKIPKDYAYHFLTQTALAMLGYDCSIDGYDGPNTRMCVRQFEINHHLDVDEGLAGPQVFGKLATLLHMDSLPSRPATPKTPETNVETLHFPSAQEYENLPKKPLQQREQACLAYLQHGGFSPIVAAGIVGNITVESHCNTRAIGDRGKSHGLCQRQGVRRETCKKFAQSKNTSVFNYQTQLDFIQYELNTTEKRAARNLRKAKNVTEATHIFLRDYERASIPHTQRRTNAAAIAYQEARTMSTMDDIA